MGTFLATLSGNSRPISKLENVGDTTDFSDWICSLAKVTAQFFVPVAKCKTFYLGYLNSETDTLILRFQVRPLTYFQLCRDQQWYIHQLQTLQAGYISQIGELKDKVAVHRGVGQLSKSSQNRRSTSALTHAVGVGSTSALDGMIPNLDENPLLNLRPSIDGAVSGPSAFATTSGTGLTSVKSKTSALSARSLGSLAPKYKVRVF